MALAFDPNQTFVRGKNNEYKYILLAQEIMIYDIINRLVSKGFSQS